MSARGVCFWKSHTPVARLPSTAKGQGRFATVCFKAAEFKDTRQKSATPCLRTEWLQQHSMDDICSPRNARALSMNLTQMFQIEISEQLSMASLEHVLLPR